MALISNRNLDACIYLLCLGICCAAHGRLRSITLSCCTAPRHLQTWSTSSRPHFAPAILIHTQAKGHHKNLISLVTAVALGLGRPLSQRIKWRPTLPMAANEGWTESLRGSAPADQQKETINHCLWPSRPRLEWFAHCRRVLRFLPPFSSKHPFIAILANIFTRPPFYAPTPPRHSFVAPVPPGPPRQLISRPTRSLYRLVGGALQSASPSALEFPSPHSLARHLVSTCYFVTLDNRVITSPQPWRRAFPANGPPRRSTIRLSIRVPLALYPRE